MKKKLLLIVLSIAFMMVYAQDDKSKMFSAGVKVGIPNLAGGSAEIHVPVFKKIAVYFDYSKFGFDSADFNLEEEGTLDLAYQEYGINYYFSKNSGRGFYLSAGLGSFQAEGSFNNVTLTGGAQGTGSAKSSFNTTNFKIGFKTGGLIYFRAEAGYGIGKLPAEIQINASSDTYFETQTELIDYSETFVSENGIPLFNFGFGISF